MTSDGSKPERPGALESGPCYELKFLLTESQARVVEDRARELLISDPYADPALGTYRTTSLYCDTPEYDVFHRLPPYKRHKHRVRRYENSTCLYLERKTRGGDRVRKLRTMIPHDELKLLANRVASMDWPGHWFHQHLLYRQLFPVCRVSYERIALVGLSPEGPLRLTFDRHIRGLMTRDWVVDGLDGGLPVLTGQVICEFKYRAVLPSLFKGIIQELSLAPQSVSKYRSFVAAAGSVVTGRALDA